MFIGLTGSTASPAAISAATTATSAAATTPAAAVTTQKPPGLKRMGIRQIFQRSKLGQNL